MSTEATVPTVSQSAASAVASRNASSTAWLWWKESRQLAPLVLLLVAVAFLILVIMSFVSAMMPWSATSQTANDLVLLVFPGLFATGAGPLLVGQERALKTIDWLSLLPLSVQRLALTKFSVALVGLIMMWGCVLVGIAAFGLADSIHPMRFDTSGYGHFNGGFNLLQWFTHSLFVLLCGFYVSWRIKNQFYSLVALIPLAFVPMLLAGIWGALGTRPSTEAMEWMTLWVTVAGIGIMLPLTHLAAIRTLGADAAPAVVPLVNLPSRSATGDSVSATAPTFGTQIAPMIWQSIHSARGTLLILIGMLVISLVAMFVLTWTHNGRVGSGIGYALVEFLPLMLIGAPLAISWLGVGVFKYDGAADQIRFLSDRGVSPGKTYGARHAVPLAILSSALLVYAALLIISPKLLESTYGKSAFFAPSLITVGLITLFLYGISQWISQMFRTLILAVILSPVIAVIVIAWFAFMATSYGFPLWGIAALSALPFLVTRFTMRRYMDLSDRPIIFGWSAIMIACFVLIPVFTAYALVQRVARMPEGQRVELLREGKLIASEQASRVHIWLISSESQMAVERIDWENGLRRDRFDVVEEELQSGTFDIRESTRLMKMTPKGAAGIDPWQYRHWVNAFYRARLQWAGSDDESAFESFAPWIESASAIVTAARSVARMREQSVADRAEMILIELLQSEDLEPYLDQDVVVAAMQAIGTPQSRAIKRREAVLADWYRTIASENQEGVGLSILDHVPSGLSASLGPRYQEQWIAALLEGIEASRSGQNDQATWLRKVHSLEFPFGVFEASRYGKRLRSSGELAIFTQRYPQSVCEFWGCDWEYVTFE